ncbi:MAG: 30S ribosomal protein S12 methylthiotransferase RimO [Bacteroidetes bacterium]|nr:30S ribosomal protein S12 methylthiotransferase RimO [Bacteroidota bacterium]
MQKTVLLKTLGCSKNRVDSERIARQMVAAGYRVLLEQEISAHTQADVLVLNTCGFIQDAKEESIEAIFAGVEAKKNGSVQRLLVFGCLTQRYAQTLAMEIPEVDGFFGVNDPDALLKALGAAWQPDLKTERILSTPDHYAYLKISEGCDRSCAYCAIPLIRGGHVSTPEETLVREAEFLAAKGVRELILVAQDTTFYGIDLYKKRMLASLMERLAQITGIEWIRLHYAYPASFPEEVLEMMAAHPKICSYLDIPLQHISNKVLTAMRRSIDEAQTRRLVDKIRKLVPDICLRTTMMVGHPGEDKRAFEQLLSFVAEARFERLGAFCYSEEEGTPAAQLYRDTVSSSVKQERYGRLMELQSGISFAYNRSRVGKRERVLIDRIMPGRLVGRTQCESPEVDGEIYTDLPFEMELCKNLIGTFREVAIKEAGAYDLYGMMYL